MYTFTRITVYRQCTTNTTCSVLHDAEAYVFADGFTIDTAAVEPMKNLLALNKSGRFLVQALGEDISLREAFECHERAICERAASSGIHPLSFAAEQLGDVWIYEKRLLSTVLCELGQMDGPIPEPTLPVPCKPSEQSIETDRDKQVVTSDSN